MKGFKEFRSRLESDTTFASKFKDLENDSQIIALAKAEGYDLEQLDDEDLDAIAGGNFWDFIKSITKPIVNVVKSIIDA